MKRPLLALSLLATAACSFQMHTASTYGGAPTAAAAPAPKPKKSAGKGKGVSVSFHKSGSIRGKINWQGDLKRMRSER